MNTLIPELKSILETNTGGTLIDPNFAFVIHSSCINHILSFFPEKEREFLELEILRIYRDEMKCQNKNSLKLDVLTSAFGFDRMSYSIFKVFYEYAEDVSKEKEITENIGEDIYNYISNYSDNNIDYSFENILQSMKFICNFFEKCGYYKKANVITEYREIKFDIDILKNGGRTYLIYRMVDPIVLPSAKQLNEEYESTCQHFSSRTIQACLNKFGLSGKEIDFQVSNQDSMNVNEIWEITKCEKIYHEPFAKQ